MLYCENVSQVIVNKSRFFQCFSDARVIVIEFCFLRTYLWSLFDSREGMLWYLASWPTVKRKQNSRFPVIIVLPTLTRALVPKVLDSDDSTERAAS